jgi:hypothetical protein
MGRRECNWLSVTSAQGSDAAGDAVFYHVDHDGANHAVCSRLAANGVMFALFSNPNNALGRFPDGRNRK